MHPVEADPFALVCKDASGVRISAPNAIARKGGVSEGMRLTDARALLPTLVTEIRDFEAEARALQGLANWCRRYAPVVSVDGVDGLWIDITGAAHLCGGEDALLSDLGKRLRTIGFASRLGLADTPGAAWAIARFHGGREAQSVPSGDVKTALSLLPLAALRLDPDVLLLLRRFGFKTIGALCEIPRASLYRRFPAGEAGEAVLHRLDQVLGLASEPIVPLQAAPDYFERISFPDPILATESFYRGLHELLCRLCRRMEMDHKGATRLTFAAYHADGGVSQVSIATARPSRDAKHLELLFRDRIETLNPGFGVDVLILSADAVARLGTDQLSLSRGAAMERARVDVSSLVDRLSNRLGAGSVQRILLHESHIPERAEIRVPALRGGASAVTRCPSKPPRPFRLLARPEVVQVLAEVPEGPPLRFTWRRVAHRVVRAEGPERIGPEWWDQSFGPVHRTRDYYRVEDDRGRRFWLFREGLYRDQGSSKEEPLPTWHMHGLFA
ncbi:Protein ImuB [Candidatus Filomicrobium marinum]|uniref:Protein ImuB n=1 Tax=Candidatus Filomicrobium marinum TaxID=1608628 RepID=A0A0D6JCQ9_9HYPH|nr:Protein ImuB [Candidatus Filomicrobium marinum]CPR16451.1 Protein ImuB [Candidatus Filomicrobium marinum]